MKMKKYASFDDYLSDQSPKNQTIIRALRKFVKRGRAETGGVSEMGQRVLGEGKSACLLRLLCSGLRAIWLFPRFLVERSAAHS